LNIPVLSFVMLRGKCRWCGKRIPWRYPVVELLTGGCFVLVALCFHEDPVRGVAGALLAGMLVAIAFIDLETGIIPDRISLPGIAVGLVASLVRHDISALDALAGLALCGGFFWVVVVASRGGMGGGDVKLGGMVGAFCGWKAALFACFAAIVLGGLAAAVLIALGRKGRKDTIPFGPFLALGAMVAFVWGEAAVGWYRSLWLPPH
jgi:leader peptidase (prepilin peptidase)/N-methyltransferase